MVLKTIASLPSLLPRPDCVGEGRVPHHQAKVQGNTTNLLRDVAVSGVDGPEVARELQYQNHMREQQEDHWRPREVWQYTHMGRKTIDSRGVRVSFTLLSMGKRNEGSGSH